MDQELQVAFQEFLWAFEEVFEYDWPYTQANLPINFPGQPRPTFLNPQVEDEAEDWGSRGLLLEKYRHLKSVMKQRGMKTVCPLPRLVEMGIKEAQR